MAVLKKKKYCHFPPCMDRLILNWKILTVTAFRIYLYSCGDNADYSPILKPYHGVYIFLNDGNNHFLQKYFFPMHGCFKAMARDFDGDGDLDIAAISFFADYQHHPEEGFVYLKNKGNLSFQPFILPETATGRWLTMDVGDFYRTGRPDIILGNFHVGVAGFNRYHV